MSECAVLRGTWAWHQMSELVIWYSHYFYNFLVTERLKMAACPILDAMDTLK